MTRKLTLIAALAMLIAPLAARAEEASMPPADTAGLTAAVAPSEEINSGFGANLFANISPAGFGADETAPTFMAEQDDMDKAAQGLEDIVPAAGDTPVTDTAVPVSP